MKKCIEALVSGIMLFAMLFSSVTAAAQTFPKPPDVPTYVAQTATYAAGSTDNVIGDGSTAWGGTPPYMASQPADIPAPATAGWIVNTGISYCVSVLPSCPEAKFRTTGNWTGTVLNDDPIRNYGLPGTSHCHIFFGNKSANAYSTFASLRNNANNYPGTSTVGGGPHNGTAYWMPCVKVTNPFGDGKDYIVKIDYAIIYYTKNPLTGHDKLVRLPRGLRYVLGHNMDDRTNSAVLAEIAAANAQAGTAGRYSFITDGFIGWGCDDGSGQTGKKKLKNSDNSDVFSPTCPSSAQIYAEAVAPECWDGVNPWSPGGYKHLRYKVRDNTLGKDTCPQNWYELPQLIVKIFFTHPGFSGATGYGNWRLSSDFAEEMACSCTVLNGSTFHTDWFGAWDDTTFMKWQNFCIGVQGNAVANQCDYSTIGSAERMITDSNAPDGSRTPQVNLGHRYGTSSAGAMIPWTTQNNGPATINAHQ